jgi:tetratricopeptide (TPR) repeat protein
MKNEEKRNRHAHSLDLNFKRYNLLAINFKRLLFYFFFFVIPAALANDNKENDVNANIDQINYFYQLNKKALPEEKVLLLSHRVIKKRNLYRNDTIAKVFLLLANVAMNKSDFSRAFQFASDGLTVPPLDVPIKLKLQLLLAKGFYAKGQYQEVLNITNKTINLAKARNQTKPMLLGLAYRSMAYALLEQHINAFADLQKISDVVKTNQSFTESIELLEILAGAHYFLGNHQMVIELYQQILKLKFQLPIQYNLEQTYFNLARSYHKLGLLDDAYNAYWEASLQAKQNALPIHLAYTSLGLGEILFLQGDYPASFKALSKAEALFRDKNLANIYLNTLISLIKTQLKLGKKEQAYQQLEQAKLLAKSQDISHEKIELYILLAEKMQYLGRDKEALMYLNKYVVLLKQANLNEQEKNLLRNKQLVERETSKQLVMRVAKESQLSIQFSKKYKRQQQLIIGQISFIFISMILIVIYLLKQRSKRFSQVYNEIEKPLYFIESPAKTKQIYQRAYKQARKYNYPLAIGYVSVENWQELSFHFNKKTLAEVNKAIATLINEYLDEFDYAGLINHGEYLLLFPHQNCQDIEKKQQSLKKALKVRFFANLGEFSVKIKLVCQTPCIQDIDPYIFLARLSEMQGIFPFDEDH